MCVSGLGRRVAGDGDDDRCDRCADVPVISDTPGSLRGGRGRRWAVFDKYGRDSICKQGKR